MTRCDKNSSIGLGGIKPKPNRQKGSIGNFVVPHRSKAGIRFNTNLEIKTLVVLTIYFRKKYKVAWNHLRFKSPHQIDHIIAEKGNFIWCMNAKVIKPLLGNDHQAVM